MRVFSLQSGADGPEAGLRGGAKLDAGVDADGAMALGVLPLVLGEDAVAQQAMLYMETDSRT